MLSESFGVDGKLGGAALWIEMAVEKGEAAMDFIRMQNSELVAKYGHDVKFAGLTFLCINNWRFNSQTFEAGIKDHHEALMGWRYDGNGTCSVSLYHRPGREDIDLSLIAAKMGGGGHKGACGFKVDHDVMCRFILEDRMASTNLDSTLDGTK